jgi:hypothetical protein
MGETKAGWWTAHYLAFKPGWSSYMHTFTAKDRGAARRKAERSCGSAHSISYVRPASADEIQSEVQKEMRRSAGSSSENPYTGRNMYPEHYTRPTEGGYPGTSVYSHGFFVRQYPRGIYKDHDVRAERLARSQMRRCHLCAGKVASGRHRARKNMKPFDLTPTWSGLLPAMLGVLCSPQAPSKAKQDVREEIIRAAKFLDKVAPGKDWTGKVALNLPVVGESVKARAFFSVLMREVDARNKKG